MADPGTTTSNAARALSSAERLELLRDLVAGGWLTTEEVARATRHISPSGQHRCCG